MEVLAARTFNTAGEEFSYLDGGPRDGPLLIFVHGWPCLAETWRHQLIAFASLGFRVVAPDTRGYGNSVATREVADYRLERLVADMLALLAHLEREDAIWIGHDWGSGIVWALAAHHPEVCAGVVNLCVPYRTIELGYESMLPLVNREIYPKDKYPFGQWEYMKYYEVHPEQATSQFDESAAKVFKLLFSPSDPATYRKPARTAAVLQNGGWFGKAENLPDIPLERTCLNQPLYEKLMESQRKHTFFTATAYYLNHAVNIPYTQQSKNDGILEMPVLFIGAMYDGVCATSCSRLAEPMRKYCRNLTECTIEAGHSVNMEKPAETNAALARWLAIATPTRWPGYNSSSFVKF